MPQYSQVIQSPGNDSWRGGGGGGVADKGEKSSLPSGGAKKKNPHIQITAFSAHFMIVFGLIKNSRAPPGFSRGAAAPPAPRLTGA